MSSLLGSLCLVVLTVLLVPGTTVGQQAPEFQVVVHRDHPGDSISLEALSEIFFKRTTRWEEGGQILPVDQPVESPVREAFSNTVLGRSGRAVAAHWQQQIFSGRGVPPTELADEASVLSYVAGRPGAIGYVSTTARLRGVKVLEVRR